MKPFLFLGIRGEDAAADDEYAAMLRFAGLEESALRRIRVEQAPMPEVDVSQYSGVILGGGPFQVSDPEEHKSDVQRRVEADLSHLLDRIVPDDVPFLGCCYGIGTLGRHEGAVIDRTFGEPAGATHVTVTDQGRADPLMSIAGPTFGAFGGHKEAVSRLPDHAVLLATSPSCPVQAFRVGRSVYAMQFHPELDLAGLALRVETYRHAGYFPPEEADSLISEARASGVDSTPNLVGRFVELFARD